MHSYEARPRKDKRGVDLVSDALPFGRLWYGEPNAVSLTDEFARYRQIINRQPSRKPFKFARDSFALQAEVKVGCGKTMKWVLLNSNQL